MELRQLLSPLRRWAWLLLLGIVAGAAVGYILTRYQTPVFQASTKVLVIASPENAVSNVTSISDQELIQTYIELLTTRPVLAETSEALGFPVSGGQIQANQIGGTKLLQVTVQDTRPERAPLIANTIVDVLISQNELLQASLYSSSEESLQVQIAQIEAQIVELQSDITAQSQESIAQEQEEQAAEQQSLAETILTLQSEIAALEVDIEALTPRASAAGEAIPTLTPFQQNRLQDLRTELAQKRFSLSLAQQRYTTLVIPNDTAAAEGAQARQSQQQATLALYQQIYSTLLGNYEAVRLARLQNTANVVQVEPATLPRRSVTPTPLMAIGAAAGLIAAAGIAFIFEFLDVSLKSSSDIEQALNLPVIGYVAKIPESDQQPKGTYVLADTYSAVAESLRSLRVNLEFAQVDKSLKTVLLTSPGPQQGKTTVLSNLAVIMAQAGRRVLLVDADLRRPTQHKTFSCPNRSGLTTLLLDPALTTDEAEFASALDATIQNTRIPGLKLLSSGPVPPNPAELLGSERTLHLLRHLHKKADLILIDSPPLVVADAALLAPHMDGILLLLEPGATRADTAHAMVDQLRRSGANVLGVVLNRTRSSATGYQDSYDYYYTGTYSAEKEIDEEFVHVTRRSPWRWLRQKFSRS